MNKIKAEKPEFLDIVDENDEIITRNVLYEDVHASKARHRVVHIMLVNEKGELLLQKRSATKASNPLYWSFSIGGHVRSGEDYLQALNREAKEELGILVRNIQFLGGGLYTDELGHKVRYKSFTTKDFESSFQLDPVEVAEVAWFSLDTIRDMIEKGDKLHPEMVVTLQKFYL